MTTANINTTADPLEADRIALRRMFKAIAEYGRQMRLRRLSNGGELIREAPDEQALVHKIQPVRCRKNRGKKGPV